MDDSAVVMPMELGRSGEDSESPEEERIAPEEGCLPATVAMAFNRELRFRPLPKEKKCCPIPEPIRTSLTPPTAWRQWVQFLLLRLPILRWLWSYQPSYIIGDLISGITVAVMHIPQGLAYALLANLPPVYGLYASFMPAIVYAIFGTSRHLSMGTFAVVALMVGESINKVLVNYPAVDAACHISMSSLDVTGGLLNGSNTTYEACATMDECTEMCQTVTTSVAITIAFVTGAIMVVMSFFQLGFITLFLSSALVSGYTTAAAVHVATSQVRHMLGVPSINATVDPGPLSVPKVWIKVFENLFQGNVNWATIIISILACTFLIIIRNVNAGLTKFKYYKKFPVPIPSQLILVAITTLISYLAMFEQRWAVSIVGEIPKEPPPLSYPNIKYIVGSVIQDSFVIAIVTFAVSVSLAQVFAKKTNHQISSNQELLAYGMTSLVSAFFSSYSPSGSLSRTTVQEVVGGKTQLVGIISSIIILAVILSIAPLFEHLPKTILAAVVVVALYGMFKQVLHLIKYWKLSKLDFMVWIFVFLATVLLGVDLGLLAGVMFSLATVLFQIILPQAYMLGQVPAEGDTQGNEADLQVYPVDGVLIFQFVAPLCYLNVGVFRSRILIESKIDPLASLNNTEEGCFMKGYLKLRHLSRRRRRDSTQSPECPSPSGTIVENPEHPSATDDATVVNDVDGEPCSPTSVQSGSKLQRNESYHIALGDSEVETDVEQSPSRQTVNKLHTIIVDCSAISFVDSIGIDELEQVVADYEKVGVQVLLATVSKNVWRMLKQSGFLQRFGVEWLFPSIQAAVDHACSGERLRHAIPTEAAAAGREPVQLTGPPGPDTAAHQLDALGALDGSIRGNSEPDNSSTDR